MRESAIAVIIPIIFLIGVVAFFVMFPRELVNLGNFVGYMSGLSTVIMVLVYVFTTSRQLGTMRSQLEEMKMSRSLQTQPLPFPTPQKAYIEAPNFWIGPPDWKMDILYRIFIELAIQNIGNGPVVAINFIPEIFFEDKNGKVARLETAWTPIDSLREGATGKVEFMFVDNNSVMINNALYSTPYSATMRLITLYKNVLGGSFKSDATYLLLFSDADKEKLKACLKIMKTSKIDYAEEIERHEALRKQSGKDKSNNLYEKIHTEFPKKSGIENIPFSVELWEGSFSVTPLTDKEYRNELRSRGHEE